MSIEITLRSFSFLHVDSISFTLRTHFINATGLSCSWHRRPCYTIRQYIFPEVARNCCTEPTCQPAILYTRKNLPSLVYMAEGCPRIFNLYANEMCTKYLRIKEDHRSIQESREAWPNFINIYTPSRDNMLSVKACVSNKCYINIAMANGHRIHGL